MGDEFIATQTQNYKRQRERACEEERQQLSLSELASETTSKLYDFVPDRDVLVGETVILTQVPGEDRIRVMRGVFTIGYLDSTGSEKVRELFTEHEFLGNFVTAEVAEESDLAGFAKVKVSI